MRYKPTLDYDQLVQSVGAAYRIPITEITFIPLGFAAASYRLHSSNRSYVLKVWFNASADNLAQKQRLQALQLARALYERNIYPYIAYPLPTTTGSLLHHSEQGTLALFPFIEGSPLPKVWSATLQDQWADTLVRLHHATPLLADVLPAREQFDLSFINDLQFCLQQLEQLDADARPYLHIAGERLRGAQYEIEAQVVHLGALQQVVQRLPSPFVLCHTDMGSDNLLLGERGQLYILDWDEAKVAPPEHDLHEARWIDFNHIINRYRNGGGVAPLYSEQFAFYILRRALTDMTARLYRLLTTNTTDEEDADALDGIEAWGFGQWQVLDETLANIQAALG